MDWAVKTLPLTAEAQARSQSSPVGFVQCVPLATEPDISLIILPLMRILRLQTHTTTDTFLFISHTTNVLLFKFRCNIFIGVGIIKEIPGSVASGTHCSIQNGTGTRFSPSSRFPLSVSFQQCYIFVFICMSLLPEQMDEACEPFKNGRPLGRKVLPPLFTGNRVMAQDR